MNEHTDTPDSILTLVTLGLVVVGAVMVYSSSSVLAEARFTGSGFFFKRHLVRAFLGVVVMFLVARINYHLFIRFSKALLFAGLALLMVLWIQKIAHSGNNARRWIRLLGISFQPSDLVKLALVIYTADSLARKQDRIRSFVDGLLPYLLLYGFSMALIVVQPDLGTAVTIGVVLLIMLFVGRVRLSHIVGVGLASVPILYALIFWVGYRKDRIAAFLHRGDHVEDVSYQIHQSLIALSSGGIGGVGLGKSTQKLLFLPEPHTDFVFSIIGEEFGLLGTLIVLSLFLILLWRGMRIARNARDLEGFFLATGITAMICVYALFNIGVATAVLPTTGLPLPFVSYGGSSLLLTLVGVGILLSISRRGKRESEKVGK
ncbi:MAG: putative lipid II flippase FtsW [Candidatus Latescibacteria bacterium 4484_107]|nr:MAG: putative lipid II flippase FtsW [Candidatus Latescibacteria bacterium 4484_107]